MGGLVIADFARSVTRGFADAKETKIWPRIVGILAYDTPYLGVHPGVFKNAAQEGWGYVQQAQAVASAAGVGWSFLQSQKGSPTSQANSQNGNSSAAEATSKSKGKQRAANQDESAMTETLNNAGKAAQAAANSSNGNGWLKYGYAAAGVGAFAAAAGTAWYSRQQIAATAANSQLWVTSHLEFVGVLWKTEALRERLDELLDMSNHSIQFHW